MSNIIIIWQSKLVPTWYFYPLATVNFVGPHEITKQNQKRRTNYIRSKLEVNYIRSKLEVTTTTTIDRYNRSGKW